jgi:hypothetical protein
VVECLFRWRTLLIRSLKNDIATFLFVTICGISVLPPHIGLGTASRKTSSIYMLSKELTPSLPFIKPVRPR